MAVLVFSDISDPRTESGHDLEEIIHQSISPELEGKVTMNADVISGIIKAIVSLTEPGSD